jgi:hypothetical protein
VNDAEIVSLVDKLEDAAEGYLTLDQIEKAAGRELSAQVASGLLLVDHRTRLDGTQVTLCRLNRHHPLVAQITGW